MRTAMIAMTTSSSTRVKPPLKTQPRDIAGVRSHSGNDVELGERMMENLRVRGGAANPGPPPARTLRADEHTIGNTGESERRPTQATRGGGTSGAT